MFLFAVPHRGMNIDDMIQILGAGKHPRESLLRGIDKESAAQKLIAQTEEFKDVIKDRKVISFYETEQTRRLEPVQGIHRHIQAIFLTCSRMERVAGSEQDRIYRASPLMMLF